MDSKKRLMRAEVPMSDTPFTDHFLEEYELESNKQPLSDKLKNDKQTRRLEKLSATYDRDEEADAFSSIMLEACHTLERRAESTKSWLEAKRAQEEDTSALEKDQVEISSQLKVLNFMMQVYLDLKELNRVGSLS